MLSIVFVTAWNLSQRRGGERNRVFGLANAVSKMANAIVLHQGPNMRIGGTRFLHYDPLLKRDRCDSLVMNLTNYYASPLEASISHLIQSLPLTKDTDIIQVEQCFPFFPAFRARNSVDRDITLSLDIHSIHPPLPKPRLMGNLLYSTYRVASSLYARSAESFAVKRSNIILSVSPEEARLLKELYGLRNVHVVPNGVDVGMFEASSARKWHEARDNVVFFHGSLSWYPNVEATDFILDYIAPKMEKSTFIICGPNPTPTFLKKIARSKNVKYLGYADRLPEYIKGSDLCIAPLVSGGGSKLKILEFAAAGRPIVATKKAVEGLPFIDKYNALLFDRIDDEFVDGMKKALSDEKLRSQIGGNALRTAQQHDWHRIAQNLLREYKGALC